MTYEEYYMELTPIIKNVSCKFNGLKTNQEDLEQEGYILIFELINKLNNVSNYKAYFKGALNNKFNNLLLEEHKKGL